MCLMVGGGGWTQYGASINKTRTMEKISGCISSGCQRLYVLSEQTERPEGILCGRGDSEWELLEKHEILSERCLWCWCTQCFTITPLLVGSEDVCEDLYLRRCKSRNI